MKGAARAKVRPAGLNTLDLRLLSTDLTTVITRCGMT